MKRAWDVQGCWNPWLSLGVHVDHTDPSVTLHLPGAIVAFGRLKQPRFSSSLRRALREEPLLVAGPVAEVDVEWCVPDDLAIDLNDESVASTEDLPGDE